MRILRAAPADMGAIISQHLQKKAARSEAPLFVFSSDVAADSWSVWAVMHPNESGVEAVALDDFTAWDRFKGSFLAGQVAEKVCIPALLRKLFVRTLIRENIGRGFLYNIIPSDDAESAYAFTDWLSKILPSLKLWHEKYMAFLQEEGLSAEDDGDGENKGYLALYTRYKDFLDKNNFFEPAWLTPEFIEQKKTIVIFFPELLEDFSDYEDVFAEAENVIAVELSAENEPKHAPTAYEYKDARSELRRTMLHLRALHEKGIGWTDMALSVPDLETYRPYIRRECERYCIPVNIRSGEPLTKNCAGLIFSQINDCYTSHFSYDSVRALLQNEYLPWKEDLQGLKENLIREGNRLRTICSYEEGEKRIDSWEEALSAVAQDQLELTLYRAIKHEVTALCEAKTFSDLHTAWLIFRQNFLSADFSEEANNILGRCISELKDIIDIEKRYVEPLQLTVEKPYAFFLNELNAKTYRPQEKLDGISVFPYKLSAAAQIPCQFVIDASQANLDIPYRKLGFLNAEKRKRLLGEDAENHVNASSAFIRLYAKSADDDVHFSYARDSFSGFAIAHNVLQVLSDKNPRAELDKEDFYKNEAERIRDESGVEAAKITEVQKKAFLDWAERTEGFEKILPYKVSDRLRKKITEKIATRRHSDKIVVTQKDLSLFYPCPRNWLFSSILNLREDSLDTSLMQPFDMGNVNHKILELFMGAMKGKYLPVTNEDGLFDEEAAIRERLHAYTVTAIHSREMDFKDSPLVLRTLESQTDLICQNLINFLHFLCKAPEKVSPDKQNTQTALKGFGGYRVLDAEKDIALTNAEGIALFGKIDCLLADPETGALVIIDYKNSTAAMPKKADLLEDENGLLGDFQIPMYARLVQEPLEAAYFYAIKHCEKNCVVDDYLGLSKSAQEAGMENPWHYDSFKKNTLPLFDRYTADFAARVQAANFEPRLPRQKQHAFVHVEPYSVCAGCHFAGICRTTFTLGERKLGREEAD